MGALRIAVVGPGLIGKRHLELIDEDPDSEVGAIVVPDCARHAAAAVRFGVSIYPDVESMLVAAAVDGVIISSPNVFHVNQTISCLEAGIPVLVEKPIAHTYGEGLRAVQVAKRTGVSLMVGHHRAHSPIMRAAREYIQRDGLGRIVAVMGSALFYKPDEYFEAGPWRKEIGGGPILINLIHEVGNLRALCGEIASVQAASSSAIREFVVEDTACINIRFESGALGVFILSDTAASARSWEQTSRENPSYPSYEDEDCYVISGTRGTLAIPSMRIKFYDTTQERSWWKPFSCDRLDVIREDPLKCQLRNFLNVIRGLEPPLVSGVDGLENLRVIEAISESIRTESTVNLMRQKAPSAHGP
jgi:predicted dehydrogenase